MTSTPSMTSRRGEVDDDRTVVLSWPVGTVAEQVGVSTSTLRSWERRYGLGPTRRTGGNHRRYGPGDVLRVRLMARFTSQGIPARTAADAIAEMDDRMVAARLAGAPDARSSSSAPGSAERGSEAVAAIVSAARDLDAVSLLHHYRRVLRGQDLASAWPQVLAPAMRRIGEEWEAGTLSVESEHLASELLQAELRALVRSQQVGSGGPPILLASADDEQHHLPLLALEAELARHGVPVVYLGPRVPARSTVRAIGRTRARAAFVWASMPRHRSEPFWGLLAEAWSGRVVIGGPGWPEGIDPVTSAVADSGRTGLEVLRADDLASAVRLLLRGAA